MALYNSHFYSATIRKYVVSVGNLFNSIHILRYDLEGVEISREKVPLAYGPKQKYIYRNTQNPDLNPIHAIKLPRVAFELVEVKYDPSRKTPSTNKLRNDSIVGGVKSYSYNAVPYEFLFEVHMIAKSTDDALQMVEQILPFFTPDYTMTINVVPELDIKLDIPITINNVSTDDNWSSDFDERREIIWKIELVLKGFLFAPVKSSKIILQAEWSLEGYDNIVLASGIETNRDGID